MIGSNVGVSSYNCRFDAIGSQKSKTLGIQNVPNDEKVWFHVGHDAVSSKKCRYSIVVGSAKTKQTNREG